MCVYVGRGDEREVFFLLSESLRERARVSLFPNYRRLNRRCVIWTRHYSSAQLLDFKFVYLLTFEMYNNFFLQEKTAITNNEEKKCGIFIFTYYTYFIYFIFK